MKTLNLSSGFTIEVTPLCPYYMDFIDDAFPLPEPITRTVTLLAGDKEEFPYDPPEEPPDEEDVEEYELWMRHRQHEAERERISIVRNRARVDFLLSTCVDIIDGPDSWEDEAWVQRVEAAFPSFRIPKHLGRRRLMFIKTQVLRKQEEANLVIQSALYEEVDMQGVANALRKFPD